MINTWEALQGLAFMVSLGLLTRGAVTRRAGPGNRHPAAAAFLPTPRVTDETAEHTEV